MVTRIVLCLATLGLSALLLAGCASRTEVIIAVESDIATLDRISIVVTSPTGSMQSSTATFGTGPADFVRTLGVTYSSGPLGPFVATANGFSGGTLVVSRTAIFEFVAGQTRVIHLDLLGRCVGIMCGTNRTCGETGCRDSMLAPSELEPYTGTIASHDAFVGSDGGPGDDAFVPPMDAGVDAPSCGAETCNGMDDDCDGMVDEDFMLQTDTANCGMCGNVCSLAHSTDPTCGGGRCAIGTCDVGFRNCDGRNSTGCESESATDPNNCGDCGVRCFGATRMCCAGICAATCP